MHYPEKFDKTIAGGVARLPRRIYPLMKYVSVAGGSVYAVTILATVIGLAIATKRSDLLAFSLVVAVFTPLAELLKFITRRPRPETIYAKNMRFKSYSFPSGHAYVSALLGSFLATIFLLYLSSPFNLLLILLVFVFSVIVGISRIYLGAHFPSDVIAGWTLGVFTLLVIKSAAL